MRKNSAALILIFISIFFFSKEGFCWGSIRGFNTHWAIINKAYKVLKDDPAFDKDKFPMFADIEKFEGSKEGPDKPGVSETSEHYYNPNLTYKPGATNAGKSAGVRYMIMVKDLQGGKYLVAGEQAAWAAHFMADMHVPYHVSGAPADEIIALYATRTNDPNPIPLDDKYIVALNLGYMVNSWANDFRHSMENFDANLKSTPGIDWYDPWYYNGVGYSYVMTSSHVLWEGAVTHPDNYDLTGLPEGWQNPKIDVNDPNPLATAAAAVTALAKAAAIETQKEAVTYIDDNTLAFNRSVQRVYTIWRASFSALQAVPSITKRDGLYQVLFTVRNRAAESAKQVKVKLVVEGGAIVSGGDEIRDFGEVPGNNQAPLNSLNWRVKPTSAKCKLKFIVVGQYKDTPDLQYTMTEETIEGEGTDEYKYYEGSISGLQDPVEKLFVARGLTKYNKSAASESAGGKVDAVLEFTRDSESGKKNGFRIWLCIYLFQPKKDKDTSKVRKSLQVLTFKDFIFLADDDRQHGNPNNPYTENTLSEEYKKILWPQGYSVGYTQNSREWDKAPRDSEGQIIVPTGLSLLAFGGDSDTWLACADNVYVEIGISKDKNAVVPVTAKEIVKAVFSPLTGKAYVPDAGSASQGTAIQSKSKTQETTSTTEQLVSQGQTPSQPDLQASPQAQRAAPPAEWTQTTTRGSSTQYEAENGSWGVGASVATDHSGYTGSGFVAYMSDQGSYSTFNVSAPSAGNYTVTLRYSAGQNGPATDRTMHIYVNGVMIRQTSMTRTTDWNTWATKAETLSLNAGTNTIQYKFDSGDTGYINTDNIILKRGEGIVPVGSGLRGE